MTTDKPPTNKFNAWLKRMGWIGFFFFLIKGLIWLAVGYFGASQIFSCQ